MTRIEELRFMRKNRSRADLSRTYGIPIRTLEDWAAGIKNPPDYVLDLLERAIREDEGLPRIYRVYMTNKASGGGDEFEQLKTANKQKAIEYARGLLKYDKRENIEIRLYTEDIDDEDCECFDYDPIEF